jgi:GT2 family glycosyltransferase
VQSQGYPEITIVAMDNGSADSAIGTALAATGVRVMRCAEPFNVSRLSNRGANTGRSDMLLFLNNDVTLRPGAIQELVGWAAQSAVGLVGCALYFPDGTLQHGGIERTSLAVRGEMGWAEPERGWPRRRLVHAARLRVVDAVSAATLMIRREVFEAVGGFDERYYPVAFSDTDLATRVRRAGLACVYTPFAEGVHHESASRRYERIEDFEGSAWLASYLGRNLGGVDRAPIGSREG